MIDNLTTVSPDSELGSGDLSGSGSGNGNGDGDENYLAGEALKVYLLEQLQHDSRLDGNYLVNAEHPVHHGGLGNDLMGK